MVFFQLDIIRFIQVYIIQAIFSIFFLFMAIRILRRDTKKLNLYLALFYAFIAVSVSINMVYAMLNLEIVVYILHFTTYYLFAISQVFVLLFLLILIKSENIITKRIQIFIISTFTILLFLLALIPGGITINKTTNWKPVWSFPFFIYGVLLSSVMSVGVIFYSIKIYSKFKNERLKRKWTYFNIGVFFYLFVNYGTLTSNFLNDELFRFIWLILSALTLPTIYLVYFGIGSDL
ncbi:MAG: hypothetical protein P8Y70_16425 [Candidatus Lokiarchaeota archaeon]